MNEIEVKILDVNPDSIRKDLKRYNAKFVKKVFQQNSLYSNGYTKKSNIIVRVRKEGPNALLTLKANKRVVRGYKMADEYETWVDYKSIVNILETLGLKKLGYTEIKREYWNIKGCSVEICILPKLPPFIEIEGSEKDILAVAQMFGYSKKDYMAENVLKYYNIKTKILKF